MVGGVFDGGLDTDDVADETLSDDAVDLDPHSAWDDGDEGTASSATVTRKRKGRGKHNRVAQYERKRQQSAASLLAAQGT